MTIAAIEQEVDAALAKVGGTFPRQLRVVLARAISIERADGRTDRVDSLVRHYCELMPRMRLEQLAGGDAASATLMRAPLHWDRLPRLVRAVGGLFALLERAGVAATVALGAASLDELAARAPTLAALYERTHYGGCMPLLYGYPTDLAYFLSRDLSLDETIDRYLTAPIIHELCHLDRAREALPPHLDECVAGFIGVHVWPEFAYPVGEHDDAIYAAPWLSQIGHAMARVFGIEAVVRAHAGDATALPRAFTDAAREHYWADWQVRRTLHFLSDTLDPAPWLDLIAGGRELAPDRDADRAIVSDAIRAMCLETERVAGSFRTRTALPRAPIVIDAQAHRVTTAAKSELDVVAPSYWIPPTVTTSWQGVLGSLDEIPGVVARVVP